MLEMLISYWAYRLGADGAEPMLSKLVLDATTPVNRRVGLSTPPSTMKGRSKFVLRTGNIGPGWSVSDSPIPAGVVIAPAR